MKKETLILFGGDGLVGDVFKRELGRKYNIVNLSLETRADVANLPSVRESISRVESPLAVVNLAAATDTNLAFSNADYQGICSSVNTTGAKNVAIVCEERNIFGVQVSTDYGYSGKKPTPYIETDPLDPIEHYGRTKANGEILAMAHGMSVATLAFPYTDKPSRPDAVAKIVQQLQSGHVITAFNDQHVTPTRIEDFVAGVDQMITQKLKGKYHVVGSSYETPHSMRVAIAKRLNLDPSLIKPSSVADYNVRAAAEGLRRFQPNLRLSNEKILKATGIQIRSFEEGINFLNQSV